MLMIRNRAPRYAPSSRLESLRVQAVIGLIIAVLVPTLVRYQTIDLLSYEMPSWTNSAAGSAFANLTGLILLRCVTAFPGTRVYGYVLPSFLTSFGIVLVGFFLFRLEYSRFDLIVSFVVSVIVAYAISIYLERRVVPRFYLVPSGNIQFVEQISGIEWVIMDRPCVPKEPRAAIVADLRFDHDDEWERMLADAAVQGHAVYHVKYLRESLTGQVSIGHLSENSFGSLLPNLAYLKVKRLSDIMICTVMMPLVLPAMAVIAVLINFDSPGGALFRQQRMGYRGRTFEMHKFRTMHAAAPSTDQQGARLAAMTQTDDDRITRVGRFLRRSRLDELPQLINVLRGEMSWIGPRPEAIALSNWYEADIPFYFYRHIVRPGITGWAQVNQGHVTDLEAVNRKLNYDFYYIKNFSAWLDILIALRTVRIMLTGFGAR